MSNEVVLFDSDDEEYGPGTTPIESTTECYETTDLGDDTSFSQLDFDPLKFNSTLVHFPRTGKCSDAKNIVPESDERTNQLKHSISANIFLGSRTPKSTREANKTAFGLFAEFALALMFDSKKYNQYDSFVKSASNEKLIVPGDTSAEKSII